MNRAFTVTRCESCGHAVFPRRLACPACGGSKWVEIEASAGEVTEVTTRRHRAFEERRNPIGGWNDREPVHLVSVRLDVGPIITARTASGVVPRQRFNLLWSSGAPLAQAA